MKSLMSQPFQHLVHIRCGRWSLRCDYFGTTMWALRKLSPHKRPWAIPQKLIFQVDLNFVFLVLSNALSQYANNSSAFPTGTPTKFSTYKHLSTGERQLPVRRLHTILHFLHHMNRKRREYHSVKHAANEQRTTQKALSGIFTKSRDCSKNLAHDFWHTYWHENDIEFPIFIFTSFNNH